MKVLKVPSSQFIIKKIDQKVDFERAEWIQRQTPEFTSVGIIPAYFMELISKKGGLVLGCYDQDHLIGYNFAFPCLSSSLGTYLFADSMAFLPEYQNKKLGYHVKLFQYICAKETFQYIVWTYDPLRGRNANLNIRKLGGKVYRYLPSLYDTSSRVVTNTDKIPADRLEVIWDLRAESVKKKMDRMRNEDANTLTSSPLVDENSALLMNSNVHSIRVQIPYDFDALIQNNHRVALSERLKSRKVFLRCFQQGFHVDNFYQEKANNQMKPKNFYILKKDR